MGGRALWLVVALLACGPGDDPSPGGAPGGRRLTGPERLVRASMSLRGVRPSPEELDRVRADPDALDAIVDTYLESPEFGATIQDLHAEVYLLRRDTFRMLPVLDVMSEYTLAEIFDAQMGEPLKLVEYIVTNDRPYTEIVTADYMFVNPILSKMYGVPHDPAGPEWQMSWWTDGRPPAGLLSSAEVLRRWESNGSNFNRARGNLIASRLLCADFDTRDISVGGNVDVSDELAVSHAVKTETSCIACHETLDPLAGYFWGYMRVTRQGAVGRAIEGHCGWDYDITPQLPYGPNHLPEYYCYPIRQYSPMAEDEWADWDLRPPSYFGTPARDLTEVGRLIAADPRFAQCTARHFYGWFAQVAPGAVPFAIATELQAVFTESGFDAKALAKAAVLHDSLAWDAVPEGHVAAPVAGLKTIRPEPYARTLEQLTGYRWWSAADPVGCDVDKEHGPECWGTVDLSTSDLYGFRAMSGGVDGFKVTHPMHTVTPTKVLATGVLAQDAAAFVVANDLPLPPDQRRLLGDVDLAATSEDAVRAQLVTLLDRVLGLEVGPRDPTVDAYLDLWNTLHDSRPAEPDAPWVVVLAAMFQDPGMVFY